MKLKKYFLYIFCFSILTNSCESILDLEPRDSFTISTAFSTLDGIEGSILGVYDRGRFVHTNFELCLYKTFYTDIIKAGTDITSQPIWNALATFAGLDATNSAVKLLWNEYYAGLNRANIIIENIDNVEYNKQNEDEIARRNTVLGEAYYFRAYFHLNLVEYWDNIVLVDQVFSDPNATYELAEKSKVYELITSDLEEAIKLLPEANDVESRGKVSKGVARHLLSLAHLDLGNWADAAAYAELVIADPAYDFAPLDQIFPENYMENREIIFSWQFLQDETDGQWTAVNLTPLYDRCNGVARTFDQGGRPWARMSPTDYYWTLFEDGDLRLEAWHKLFWIYDIDSKEDPLPAGVSIGDTVTAANIDEVSGNGARVIEPTTKKYWEGDGLGRAINDAPSYKNVILFRYSEAFLIAAEGYLRSGNISSGQTLFDQLRARAGLGSLELNETNLLDEQARELGFEGRRYPMLKRLGILEDRIKTYSPEIGNNMLSFHVRLPIPKTTVDLTGIPQNEGYE
jgi:hypothetical protein